MTLLTFVLGVLLIPSSIIVLAFVTVSSLLGASLLSNATIRRRQAGAPRRLAVPATAPAKRLL